MMDRCTKVELSPVIGSNTREREVCEKIFEEQEFLKVGLKGY